MSVLRLTLTEDHLKLISQFHFGEMPNIESTEIENPTFGLDMNSLYGGSYLCEDVSMILGRYDEHIDGTEEDPTGVKFPQETEDYFWTLQSFILEHLSDIEEIVHQFVLKGGVTPGTYKCKNNEHIWTKVEE